MKRLISVATVLTFLLGGIWSVNGREAFSGQRPRFEDYPAEKPYTGPVAPVDLGSHKQAKTFRTNLRDGAAEGPNFAGHYTVVEWGCGTECVQLAIVDAKNGKIYFPLPSAGITYSYRIDSNLLIVNPPEEMEEAYGSDRPAYTASEYFVWDGNRLKSLYKEVLPGANN